MEYYVEIFGNNDNTFGLLLYISFGGKLGKIITYCRDWKFYF